MNKLDFILILIAVIIASCVDITYGCISAEQVDKNIDIYNSSENYHIKRVIYSEVSDDVISTQQQMVDGKISAAEASACINRQSHFFDSIDNDDSNYHTF